MADVKKGIVTQVTEGGAIIRPYGSGSALTPVLPVQKIKIEKPEAGLSFEQLHPMLAVGDPVAFVLFEDGTGIIIDKMQ
jgi:hypothetical protein